MRVTHVITRLIIGGAQENTVATVLGLQRTPGLETDLISGPTTGPEGSLEAHFARAPELLTLVPSLVRPVHPWKDIQACRCLARIFRKKRPDIVHTHSGKAGVLGRLAARSAGVRAIVHTVHGPSFGPFQGRLPNFLFRSAERAAGKVTTHFVTVAQAMTDQYLAAGIGRPEQYTRIFSGFHLPPFLDTTNDPQLRAQLGIGRDDIVIGKIARLFKLKGHEDLFAVAPAIVQSVPNAKFLLVGDGPWRERFERQAHDLRLSRHFIFTGLVPPDQVSRYVGIMDMLAHLSLREGLPRALPQALAAARPVIAYNCDGAREVCRDGETGFLIKPGDLQRLAERIVQLARRPDLRDRLGTAGRQWVQPHFSVERMVEDLHALYLKLTPQPVRAQNSSVKS
jgi:glycosyltransferase involved in cell wall biosynthesis